MNEYISKEYIRNVVLKHWSDSVGAECYAYSRVLDDIYEAPTMKVAYGRWIWKDGKCFCSVCNKQGEPKFVEPDGCVEEYLYCPNCGARMDLED